MNDRRFLIAQISDIHCGDIRFDGGLMSNAIEVINGESPDLLVVAGDLTEGGYREEFEEAAAYIERIQCPNKLVIAGNHDCRNVGYIHFENIFGPRSSTISFTHSGEKGEHLSDKVKVVAVDSNKADVNDGEVGRHNYRYIEEEFSDETFFKIFVLHHHLIHIPGTGRERNIVWDSGDVLEVLRELRVDLVLNGHKHVPYTWPLGRTYLVTSGTASTWRVRGITPPSLNFITIEEKEISVEVVATPDGKRTVSRYPRWWYLEELSEYRH